MCVHCMCFLSVPVCGGGCGWVSLPVVLVSCCVDTYIHILFLSMAVVS